MHKKHIIKTLLGLSLLVPSFLSVSCNKNPDSNNEETDTITYTKVDKVEATCLKEGHETYYIGSDNKYYSDELGQHEITLESTIIPKIARIKVEHKLPTYTEVGNIEHFKCPKCGNLFLTHTSTEIMTKEDVSLGVYEFLKIEVINKPSLSEEGKIKLFTKSQHIIEPKVVEITLPKLDDVHYEKTYLNQKEIEDVVDGQTQYVLKENALDNYPNEKLFFSKIKEAIGNIIIHSYLPAKTMRAVIFDIHTLTDLGLVLEVDLKYGSIKKDQFVNLIAQKGEATQKVLNLSYKADGQEHIVDEVNCTMNNGHFNVLIGTDFTYSDIKAGGSIYSTDYKGFYVYHFKGTFTSLREVPIFDALKLNMKDASFPKFGFNCCIHFNGNPLIKNEVREIDVNIDFNRKYLIDVNQKFDCYINAELVGKIIVTEVFPETTLG